jgi:hypothetical protein
MDKGIHCLDDLLQLTHMELYTITTVVNVGTAARLLE